MPVSTLYVNGKVFTGTKALQSAFAVKDGRFQAVGSDAQVLALRREGDEVCDLGGRFVCPGFIDSHMHLLHLGSAMTQCDLSGAASLEEVQQRLKSFIARAKVRPGQWVVGHGFNQDLFPDRCMPDRHDLDAVSSGHPICAVRCCGHALVANTMALRLMGVTGHTPQPDGGRIALDADGVPTGVLEDTAMSLAYACLPSPGREEIKDMLRTAFRAMNAVGVTSCHSDDLCNFEGVDFGEVIAAYRELADAGEMTVRVYEQSQMPTPERLRDFFARGYNTGWGDAYFRIGPLKLVGDGSLGARTAFLREGYHDAPEQKGLALFTQEQLDELILLARSHGMQVAVHAIGDAFLDRLLSAYEKAFAAYPCGDHRCGVVHVQLTRPEQLRRMAKLSLHAYVQTVFLDYDIQIVQQRAGKALADTSYAFHTLKELGLHVSNGTDCPVEAPSPLRGLQCAVTRRTLDGRGPYRPEETMDVCEALNSYTAEGAWASFEENEKGRIAPGMLADFTVLSGSPFDVPADEISRLTVEMTFLGGQRVFSRVSE